MVKKIVILGNLKTGKTALLDKALGKKNNAMKPSYDSGPHSLWEAGKITSTLDFLHKKTNHYVICVDFSQNDNEWLEDVTQWTNLIKQRNSANVPVTLIATKLDLAVAVKEDNSENSEKDSFERKIDRFRQLFLNSEKFTFDAIYLTSAIEDAFNFKLGKNTSENQPLTARTIFDEICNGTSMNSVDNPPSPINVINKRRKDSTSSDATDVTARSSVETQNADYTNFKDSQKVITVGELRELCNAYKGKSEGHPIKRNNGFWRFSGLGLFNVYGSTSMKNLAKLCKDRDSSDQLTESEINKCLSKHRIAALNDWIENNSLKPRSGTEQVIREIYRTYSNSSSTAQQSPRASQ